MQEKTAAKIREFCGEQIKVHYREIQLERPFMEVAAHFSGRLGTVVLMSGGELDCSRYHILGINPWLTLEARHRQIRLTRDGTELLVDADPFESLRCILNECKLPANGFPVPICAGFMGYFAYDLKDVTEQLPRTSVDTLGLPHMLLYAPSAMVIHDKKDRTSAICMLQRSGVGNKALNDEMASLAHTIMNEEPPEPHRFLKDSEGFTSNFEKPDYLRAIEKIIDYIGAGDVYQVNMSQRFETGFAGDPFFLFKDLYERNPAPFFAFIHAGEHHIVSTSPERFLLLEQDRVETRPIKGTRPRAAESEEDERMKQELLASPKDDAELSMIVDLLRNDIGKVCREGSVRVAEHKRLEAYQNVYHLVSIVEGTLDTGRDAVDLIRETFPGGSITGCPKIRSMEIIDELEPCRRHVYTGSIGYLSFHGTMDLNIAIRTATVFGGKIYVSVGGGIVYDSIPEEEFYETLHKGRTFLSVFSETGRGVKPAPMAWINGRLVPVTRARVSVSDEGLQYGFGIFETIRVVDGTPQFLSEHLERLSMSWGTLFPDSPPDLTWDRILEQVIHANGLENETAAVKILATRGHGERPSQNRALCVTARPYIHRLTAKNVTGLDVKTYPEPRLSPLTDHKTCNYLYYLRAGRWADENGAHEALILNPDLSVSETNTANILVINGKSVVVPHSEHSLPGIMQDAVLKLLSRWGFVQEIQKIFTQDLFEAEHVILTNSLMGAVPAHRLDGRQLSPGGDICQKLNDTLLKP